MDCRKEGTWLRGPAAPSRLASIRDRSKLMAGFADICVRLDSDFSVATANDEIHALVFQPDGGILIGGDFTKVNGVSRNGLARLHGDHTSVTSLTIRSTQGRVHIRSSAPPGIKVAVEFSSDLTAWLPIHTNTASGLMLEFEDSDAPNLPRRFYRARKLNP